MPTTTLEPTTIVELTRELEAILEDATTYRTDCDGCWDCTHARERHGPGRMCEDHENDAATADTYAETVRRLQAEAEWAARDAAALDQLAEIVRTATACASAAELLSRVAVVLVDAGRQVSPTTD